MSISAIGSSSFTSAMMSRMSATQMKRPDPSEFASQLIQEEDQDGDGMVSAAESRVDSDRFGEIDTDTDGFITAEELEASLKSAPPQRMQGGAPPPPPPSMDAGEVAARVLEQDDADGDGVISAAETSMDSDLFTRIDANEDGVLTVEELTEDYEAFQAEMAEGAASSERPNLLDRLSSGDSSLSNLLARNSANSAYSDQSWVSSLFEQTTSGFALTA